MTFSSGSLSNTRKYTRNLQIHVADGEKLLITSVGDISYPFPPKNVVLSPSSANLVSVGRLVDDYCHVSFFKYGCIVQDQVSGKVIAKGPKCGRLFPFHLSNLRNKPKFSFLCVPSQSNWKLWHNR